MRTINIINAHFIKIAWRKITRNKVYSSINILGLAIGIACGLVIYKIINYENSFDKYHKNYAKIHRVINQYNNPVEGIGYGEGQVHPLGAALRNDFPGVIAVMTFYAKGGLITIKHENGSPDRFQENKGLVYAEPQIFEVFDFNFLAGDPNTALSNTESIVISSSQAQKFFSLDVNNASQAIGKTLIINNTTIFTVTGVISDPPQNTDLPFTMIARYENQTTSNPYFRNGTDWKEYNSATNCYVLLTDNINPADFEAQLASFFVKYNGSDSPDEQKYLLQPLSDLHFGLCNNYNNRQVSKSRLMLLGIIGLFIIALASINFINLSTAQASKRFKEIGVKKMAGISKPQLVFQLMGEPLLISFIAAIVGLIFARILFIYLEDLLGYAIHLELIKDSSTLVFLVGTTLLIGIISGLYPSIVMAGMKPVSGLRSSLQTSKVSGSISMRSALVITQFAISLVLITGTLVMKKQMKFFLSKDLGFDKNAIVISSLPNADPNKLKVLKSNLLQYPEIVKVSFNTASPMADWRVGNAFNYPGLEKDVYSGNLKTVDEDYLDLYDLKLIAGKNITDKVNTGDVVVTDKITKILGFDDPHDALGEIFTYGVRAMEFKIVGVVEDFYAQSLQEKMDNVILSNVSFNVREVSIKLNPGTASFEGYNTAMDKVQAEWSKIFPDDVYSYYFLDNHIASYYSEEAKTLTLIQLFALIAIFIGSLGLYGLISFIANQKIKEIGIRKVNGAKVSEVMTMLNKDFVKWVAIAFVIATPIAYYAMNKWLENFAYKTDLSWWIFALAGVLALGIALLTVSWQSWKAATRNPVEALRYE